MIFEIMDYRVSNREDLIELFEITKGLSGVKNM